MNVKLPIADKNIKVACEIQIKFSILKMQSQTTGNLHEWFFTSVQSFMRSELSGLCIGFGTITAFIRLHSSVFRHVRFEGRMRRENLWAEGALVFVVT